MSRGLARRAFAPPREIGVDETAFKRRHDYVTSVIDLARDWVLHVADGRSEQALGAFYEQSEASRRAAVQTVAMDMWPAYIKATRTHVPHAAIVFDKFHIAKHLSDAVDQVRRSEHRALTTIGDRRLAKTKYLWLMNPSNMDPRRWRSFAPLRQSHLRVARAWAIKEFAMGLWGYVSRGWAERGWKRWYAWVIRCRLAPIKVEA